MKRPVITALVIALAAGAWILSGQFELSGSDEPQSPAATAEAREEQPLEVRVRQFTSGQYRPQVTVSGRTEAVRRVVLRAQTAGQIEELGAAKGSPVREGDLIARIGVRDRQARLAEAEALVAQRRAELNAARQLAEKGYRARTQLAADEAAHDQAMARLKQIQVEIEEPRIRAPFDGVLEERAVEIGNYLEPGNDVATVVDLDPILVVGSLNERAIGGISVGTPGRARLATGETVEGKVRYISSVANPETRTFRIELEVENGEGRVRDGVTAELILPGRPIEAHKIPASLLTLSDIGELGVKAVDDSGRVSFLPVSVLADEQGGTWVDGLPETVDLITVGQEFAVDGELVQARPENGGAS